MNKYRVTIPYSYRNFGDVTGYYNADSEDEVRESLSAGDLEDAEYDDGNYSGESEYDYHDMEIELVEEDIDGDEEDEQTSASKGIDVPVPYYLEEINKV